MANRIRAKITLAHRSRQEKDRSRECSSCAESSQETTVPVHKGIRYHFRRTLLGLGVVVSAIVLVSAAISLFIRPDEGPFLARNDAAMSKMMAAMKIKPSNNVDRDFVAMMVPHHQGAIDMAQAELSYGHNEPLRRLAQGIIVTQQEEIAEMRLALVNTSTSTSQFSGPDDISFMAKSDAAMSRMMAAMKIRPSNNVDKDFVAMMVPHHQGAIDMAQAELSYGHNEPLRGLAQEIIATQQQEIVAMQLDVRE
jgi:uncharacterized protein (DUF305 family)